MEDTDASLSALDILLDTKLCGVFLKGALQDVIWIGLFVSAIFVFTRFDSLIAGALIAIFIIFLMCAVIILACICVYELKRRFSQKANNKLAKMSDIDQAEYMANIFSTAWNE